MHRLKRMKGNTQHPKSGQPTPIGYWHPTGSILGFFANNVRQIISDAMPINKPRHPNKGHRSSAEILMTRVSGVRTRTPRRATKIPNFSGAFKNNWVKCFNKKVDLKGFDNCVQLDKKWHSPSPVCSGCQCVELKTNLIASR